MNAIVRKANESDFDGVGKVFAQELEFHIELLPEMFKVADPLMTPEWYHEKLSNPDKALFVAELGKEIIGVLQLESRMNPDDPIFRPCKYVHVVDIGVAQRYRGRGIGRLLMDRAKEWALGQGVNEIELNVWELNKRALGFYESLGYQTKRRTLRLVLTE